MRKCGIENLRFVAEWGSQQLTHLTKLPTWEYFQPISILIWPSYLNPAGFIVINEDSHWTYENRPTSDLGNCGSRWRETTSPENAVGNKRNLSGCEYRHTNMWVWTQSLTNMAKQALDQARTCAKVNTQTMVYTKYLQTHAYCFTTFVAFASFCASSQRCSSDK